MDKYSDFGISFRKNFLVSKGASPVFYVASTSMVSDATGRGVTRAQYFGENVATWQSLLEQLIHSTLSQDNQFAGIANKLLNVQHFLDFHVFSFLKFFDPSREERDQDNFYMEREWRVYGNVDFRLSDVSRITLPGPFADRLKTDVPDYKGCLTKSETAIR